VFWFFVERKGSKMGIATYFCSYASNEKADYDLGEGRGEGSFDALERLFFN